ncbi:DinB/UmuC family translesion DNA polymerase [Streptomyces anulatus]|uniref:DinB/UmuC family translesion DNA polymerase n=1 Tax=Streptomyces anulatus TaxID=1892 RepID=UPI003647B385
MTQALTLTVTYADRTQTTRSRTLTEATAHTPALATTARELLTSLGLQRARVRTLALRAERLRPAEDTVHQLTFDDRDHKLRRLERLFAQVSQQDPLIAPGAQRQLVSSSR